ncbi:MAG: hypothetical protein CMM46_14060 [Rhodospirillaceae bacterium]|nr:hypothetical protein [Rhodospirillaceae bacterium]
MTVGSARSTASPAISPAVPKFFGLDVIGVRRTGTPHADVDEMHRPEDLHTLLPRADFIVLTAPPNPATERLFGAQGFALMKPGVGFVLYSRSKLVDYEALCRALEAGRISAIVDVFDEEPLPASSPLWQTPNLLITPHASSNDPAHHAPRSLDLLFENLGRMFQGKELNNIVDLEQLY